MNRGKLGNTNFPTGLADRLDPVCDRFEDAWLAGGSPRLEDFLLEVAEDQEGAIVGHCLDFRLGSRYSAGKTGRLSEKECIQTISTESRSTLCISAS